MKSNLIYFTLIISSFFLLSASPSSAAVFEKAISLSASSWQVYSSWGGSAEVVSSDDGIVFSGSGHRQGTQAISREQTDMRNASLYIKWMVHGPAAYGGYGAFGVGAGRVERYGDSSVYAVVGAGWCWPTYGPGFSSRNSWAGSKVLTDDIWYYTRISISSDRTVSTITASGDYDDRNGTVFYSHTHTLSEANMDSLATGSILISFNDNYGGSLAWLKVGEAKIVTDQVEQTTLPSESETFTHSPVSWPFLDRTPDVSRPLGLGLAAEGGSLLDMHVGLNAFSSPVDIYVAVQTTAFTPNDFYLFRADGTTQRYSIDGLIAWKQNQTGAVKEDIVKDIPLSSLPDGTYNFYHMVTPANRLDPYYLWVSSLDIRTPDIHNLPSDLETGTAGLAWGTLNVAGTEHMIGINEHPSSDIWMVAKERGDNTSESIAVLVDRSPDNQTAIIKGFLYVTESGDYLKVFVSESGDIEKICFSDGSALAFRSYSGTKAEAVFTDPAGSTASYGMIDLGTDIERLRSLAAEHGLTVTLANQPQAMGFAQKRNSSSRINFTKLGIKIAAATISTAGCVGSLAFLATPPTAAITIALSASCGSALLGIYDSIWYYGKESSLPGSAAALPLTALSCASLQPSACLNAIFTIINNLIETNMDDCTPQQQQHVRLCYKGDVHWYNDCLVRYDAAEECPCGCENGDCIDISQCEETLPLRVSIGSDTGTCLEPGDTVFFSSRLLTDMGNNRITYQWNFGDGGTSVLDSDSHTFTREGTYTVSLTISDDEGNFGYASLAIKVGGCRYLLADIRAEESCYLANEPARFISSVSGGDPNSYQYLWNFGEGSISSERNPVHIYTAPGTYTVRMMVTDSGGGTVTAETTVQIGGCENHEPVDDCSAPPSDSITIPGMEDWYSIRFIFDTPRQSCYAETDDNDSYTRKLTVLSLPDEYSGYIRVPVRASVSGDIRSFSIYANSSKSDPTRRRLLDSSARFNLTDGYYWVYAYKNNSSRYAVTIIKVEAAP